MVWIRHVAYLIRLHDYDDSVSVAIYTDRQQAENDLASRGENASLTEVPLDPDAPPLLKWTIWPSGGGAYSASWSAPMEDVGVHDWLHGRKCAVVEAVCEEGAIEAGRMLIEGASCE